jgi:hypothetical protein
MDSGPPIIDLHAALAKLTMLRGRTPQSTMEDRTGVEEELSELLDLAAVPRRLNVSAPRPDRSERCAAMERVRMSPTSPLRSPGGRP